MRHSPALRANRRGSFLGTSSSHKGPKSKQWAKARRLTTAWAKEGGGPRIGGVVAGAVGALAAGTDGLLGGVGPAAGSRLGGLLGGFVQHGTDDASLTENGLARLVGLTGVDLQLALLEILAPDDEGGLERSAVRKAMDCVVSEIADQMDAGDEPWSQTQVERLLLVFWGEYIAALVLQGIGEAILRASPTKADRMESDIRQYVRARLENMLRGRDLVAIDWTGDEGRRLSEQIRGDVLEILGETE